MKDVIEGIVFVFLGFGVLWWTIKFRIPIEDDVFATNTGGFIAGIALIAIGIGVAIGKI